MVSSNVLWYQLLIYGIKNQCSVIFFLTTGDQPERRELNYIMGGNSNFSSRFRYSGHLKKLKEYLPPCKSCFAQMRENSLFLKSNILCTNCVNWNIMINSPSMLCASSEVKP